MAMPVDWPAIHPAVEQLLRPYRDDTKPLRLIPVGMDVKQAEFARCLLLDGANTFFTTNAAGAVPLFCSTMNGFDALFRTAAPPISVIFDFHDKGRRLDFIDLSEAAWQLMGERNLQVMYVKLQVHDVAKYAQLNRDPANVHVLSCPLLLGGSRFHITVQDDFDGDALFSRTLNDAEPPADRFDWSFVGAPTSDDRAAAFAVLKDYTARPRFFTVSQPGHADASVATVPMAEMLSISRASKVCLSLNGRGPWCLKDGELFAAGCCVLRQWHPTLAVNPLTPRDGEHWAVAKTEDLVAAIELLLADDQRRREIARAGHALLRDVVANNAWSRAYASALARFFNERLKESWGNLAIA